METKEITKEMFAQPNAGEVILNLVREGAVIDEEIHLKVFALDNAAEILLEYAKHGHELSDKAQARPLSLRRSPVQSLCLARRESRRDYVGVCQAGLLALL